MEKVRSKLSRLFCISKSEEFYEKLSISNISYPFLVRVNNSVSGKGSVLVRDESQLESALQSVERDNNNRIGINRQMMCIQFINTIDKDRDVNVSYRIHSFRRQGYLRLW